MVGRHLNFAGNFQDSGADSYTDTGFRTGSGFAILGWYVCNFSLGVGGVIFAEFPWCNGCGPQCDTDGYFCVQTILSLWRTKQGLFISLVCILLFTHVLLIYIPAHPLRVLRPWHLGLSCANLMHKTGNLRKPKTPNKQTNLFSLFSVNFYFMSKT